MELRINTESPAARAIIAIAHAAGTAEIYLNTLSRLSNAVLFNQDDMGMDDTETIDTLRVLSLLRNDIQDIATDKTIASALERADRQHEDVQTDMVREGNPAEKLAEITEAIKMQKKAADTHKRNLAELTASENKEEGGDE